MPETSRKICEDLFLFSSSGDQLKKNFKDLFRLKKIFEDFFFEEHLLLCPWPWPQEGLFLALALEFFCVLGLEPCILDSTSDYYYSVY